MFKRCENNRFFVVALALLMTGIVGGFAVAAEAADYKAYYVAINGSDENAGTLDKPFGTIQKAADVMKAGDTCYIREGRYRKDVSIKNSHGGKDKPLTFTAYKGERVVLDGSTPISAKWTKHEGQIYRAKTEETVLWQLFVDGKSMCSARWPNGNWDDGSIWDKKKSMAWPEKDKSDFGLHYNQELKEFDFSLKGAIIVINSGSFKTYTSRVKKHVPGDDHFSFSTYKVRRHFDNYPVAKHGYFLEGNLGLLDVPGEWHFDPENKTVYLWPLDGKNPNDLEISGKVRSYMFDVMDSSYIRLEGIDFFGSTFSFIDSHHCEVVSCDLMYPSYSRRMMNSTWPIKVTKNLVAGEFAPAYNKIIDCTMEYMDGPAIHMDGKGNVIENCYFHDVDYSCTYDGGWTTNTVDAPELVFRRNTIHTTGASELFK
ncbi:MAG: hypothetical protein KAR47_21190, partial [Planctomycetes bacterium]|nr:hypothetical protein [Planctomycetota bacterium]